MSMSIYIARLVLARVFLTTITLGFFRIFRKLRTKKEKPQITIQYKEETIVIRPDSFTQEDIEKELRTILGERLLSDSLSEQIKELSTIKHNLGISFVKAVQIDYFEIMTPNKTYPFKIVVSDEIKTEELKKALLESVEKYLQSEKEAGMFEELKIILESSIVNLKLIMPGCIVAPSEVLIDFTDDVNNVTFYVTPLSRGKMEGYIEFLSGDYSFSKILLNPNIRPTRSITVYGSLISVIPLVFSLLGLDILSSFKLVGNFDITHLIAILGIIISMIIGSVLLIRSDPKKAETPKIARIG